MNAEACQCGWVLPEVEIRFSEPVEDPPVVLVTCPCCGSQYVIEHPDSEEAEIVH
jgi:hypothetical protein